MMLGGEEKKPVEYTRKVTREGKPVPECKIEFHCPYEYKAKKSVAKLLPEEELIDLGVLIGPCNGGTIQDAYLGPVQCLGTKEHPHSSTFMIPVRLLV